VEDPVRVPVTPRSASGLRLAPLDCPSCGAAVAADSEDIVYYCTACRNGYRFEDARSALAPVEVAFVSLPNRQVDLYLPFWLLPARVEIRERGAAGGGFSGLLSLFTGGDRAASSSGGEGTFAVPAFAAPLGQVTDLTQRYTRKLPELGERLGERLTGGCYQPVDAEKLAHYSLIDTEVAKSDTLQKLDYSIEFGAPRLLGVPFVRQGKSGGVADAYFGVSVSRATG